MVADQPSQSEIQHSQPSWPRATAETSPPLPTAGRQLPNIQETTDTRAARKRMREQHSSMTGLSKRLRRPKDREPHKEPTPSLPGPEQEQTGRRWLDDAVTMETVKQDELALFQLRVMGGTRRLLGVMYCPSCKQPYFRYPLSSDDAKNCCRHDRNCTWELPASFRRLFAMKFQGGQYFLFSLCLRVQDLISVSPR